MKRSYKIAIAAVSCAIAVLAVVAQAYVSTVSIALNVVAALAISLPLTQRSVSGAIFSYVAASLIGFLAVNVKALPFIIFYAPYAIIAYAADFVFYKSEKVRLPKWVKIAVITVVKLAFFGAAFYACLTLMKVVVSDIALFGWKWTLPLLMLAGFICFCTYDPLYRFVFVNMEKVVSRYVSGGRRSGKPDIRPVAPTEPENAGGDVFEGFGESEVADPGNGGRGSSGIESETESANVPENANAPESVASVNDGNGESPAVNPGDEETNHDGDGQQSSPAREESGNDGGTQTGDGMDGSSDGLKP